MQVGGRGGVGVVGLRGFSGGLGVWAWGFHGFGVGVGVVLDSRGCFVWFGDGDLRMVGMGV